jgi:hypothetical protein
LVQYDEDRCRVFVVFPQEGLWSVELFGRPRSSKDDLAFAGRLGFKASSGTAKRFPTTYSSFGQLKGHLFSPLYVPLPNDKSLTFKVRLVGAYDVSLVIGRKTWLKLKPVPGEKDTYQLTTGVGGAQPIRLNAKTVASSKSYATVIDFTANGR